MIPGARSSVLAGAVLAAALSLGTSAPPGGIWSLAGPWLGDLWSRAVAAVGLGNDLDTLPAPGEASDADPSGDVGWGLDPNG